MKTILFPTDFSKSDSLVFHYALNLAKVFDAEIRMMHAFGLPLVLEENPDYDKRAELLVQDLKKFSEANMQALYNHIKIVYMAEVGFPAEAILEAAEDENIDLIVMGTKGKKNVLDRYFGSVSTAVMDRAQCPVLLVPPGNVYNGWNHLGCTINFSFEDLMVIQTLNKWKDKFKAKMTCLHVLEGGNAKTAQSKMHLLEDIFTSEAIHFQIKSGSIIQAINQFEKEAQLGLLAMAHHHRGLITHLIHSDITRAIAQEIKVPLLVFNQK